MYTRATTRKLRVGNRWIGGGSPVLVQSMTTTATADVRSTVKQIDALAAAGCEMVRVSVPDAAAARALGSIRKRISLPLVADIHFDYRLALAAIDQGVDKLRINPGNIGSAENVAAVVRAAKAAGIPLRIGVNAGSLKSVHACTTAEHRARALVAAALRHIRLLEELEFYDIVVSLKASDVATTAAACRLFARKKPYPQHLGITEAGSLLRGSIKSAVGLGIILFDGIGDTIRVSLTADPVEEMTAAWQILQALGLRSTGVDIISCPTCARCSVDLISMVNELELRIAALRRSNGAFTGKPCTIAVMGCVVNGPGEASAADIGIAGGADCGMLFKHGKVVGKVPPSRWVRTLVDYVRSHHCIRRKQ